jgi:phage virion morphogenesis protein
LVVSDNGTATLLADVASRLANIRIAIERAAAMLESRVHARFDTKTGPDGGAWHPWSAATQKARAKSGRGTLLEYTGKMRASVRWAMTGPAAATVQIGAAYASVHEYGMGKMPARRMLTDGNGTLSAADTQALTAVVQNYLQGIS